MLQKCLRRVLWYNNYTYNNKTKTKKNKWKQKELKETPVAVFNLLCTELQASALLYVRDL